jgi:hypothetical protein
MGDSLWIGNPDRLNGDLKFLRHYLSTLDSGSMTAWNEHEMMGYDSFAMAGTSPNPLIYLASLFGMESMYFTLGYVLIVLLFAAGAAGYAFLRALLPAGLPTIVGAICYEFSSWTLLKGSQNSMTFAVLIMIPLLMLAIHHIRRDTASWCFLALSLLLGYLLNYMFLQKAAYALMLVGSYAVWRSWSEKSLNPVLVFGLAFFVSVILSSPRIFSIGLALQEFKRSIAGLDFKDFNVLYDFQNIRPYEILRWLDGSLFGLTPSDSHAIGNNINLTEGLLLYTSSIVPLVLIAGLIRSRYSWLKIFNSSKSLEGFFFWALVVCISVILFKPVAYVVFLLFFKLDFTHARIQISALLPLSFLVAMTLTRISPTPSTNIGFKLSLIGFSTGLGIALIIEHIAQQFLGSLTLYAMPSIRLESLIRIILSSSIFLILYRELLHGKVLPRQCAYIAICAMLIGQCLISVNRQVNGTQAFNFIQPFKFGDFYHARRGEFEIPTEWQLQVLHDRIDPINYRVALICDKDIADGFCAGHVPEFWQLRAIDGYFGPGVPRRLRSLPWPNGISLRTVSFNNLESVPWDLLGLINVRWALVSGDGVFRNILREGDRIVGLPDPNKFELILSPARVTPRAFFAESVKPVSSPEDAVAQLFRSEGIVDPIQTSFVEGLTESKNFGFGTSITLKGAGDTLSLQFASSSEERFLVLNDLFYPGWRAEANGRNLPILATNAVMRGVIVPPGVASLTFHYSSFLDSDAAWALRGSAVFVMLAIFLVLRRKVKKSEPDS